MIPPRFKNFTPRTECLESCTHLDITEELLRQALEDEKNLSYQKGIKNPTTLALNARRDFIGSIAHNGVLAKLAEYGLLFEESAYFNPKASADLFDFSYNGGRVDVQGTLLRPDRYGNRTVHRFTSFLIKDEKEHKDMDYYCFTAIDLQRDVLHIAGVIPYPDTWRLDNRATHVPHAARQIYARDLRGLKSFVFKI